MSGREKIQRAVISALLALVLWGWLQVQGETTRQAVAPLEFLAVPAGLAVADAGATEVSVTLRGLPSRMARVDSKDLKVVIDLSGAREGTTKFFLNEDRLVGLPAGLVLDGISPYSVAVRLEPLAEKDVPVRAASEGEVDPDYVLDGITIIPGQIRFRGPRSKVGLMAEAATAKISLEGLSASETRAVALAGDPKFLAFVEPSIVEARIRVREKLSERVVKGVTIEPVPPPGLRVRVIPPQVDVTISGPVSKVRGIEPRAIQVKADARGYGPGRHRREKPRITLRVDPPREDLVIDYEPKEFELVVTR